MDRRAGDNISSRGRLSLYEENHVLASRMARHNNQHWYRHGMGMRDEYVATLFVDPQYRSMVVRCLELSFRPIKLICTNFQLDNLVWYVTPDHNSVSSSS